MEDDTSSDQGSSVGSHDQQIKRPNWRRRIFWLAVLALFVPLPTGDGYWLPILFMFFDWTNQFLPENF